MKKIFDYSLIMSAGSGSRMSPLTDYIPKALVCYKNKELIDRAITIHQSVSSNVFVTVGHKKELLTKHLVNKGSFNLMDTSGHDNVWWVFNSVMKEVDKPVFVSTCDNFADINFDSILSSIDLSSIVCLLILVDSGGERCGDYIEEKDNSVISIGREKTKNLCSGFQIINPYKINQLIGEQKSFRDLWESLIEKNALNCISGSISNWDAIDNFDQIAT